MLTHERLLVSKEVSKKDRVPVFGHVCLPVLPTGCSGTVKYPSFNLKG